MAKTLVFLEHHEGAVQKGSLGVLAKAAQIGGEFAGVDRRLGRARDRATSVGATVWVADDARLRAPLAAAARRRAREARARRGLRHGAVRAVGSRRGHRRRVSLRGSAPASTGGSSTSTARRDARRRCRTRSSSTSAGRRRCASAIFRAGALDAEALSGTADVRDAAVELEDFSTAAEMVEQAHAEQQGPSIEDAEIIVAGGRGLGEPEKFALAEELARALGGAVAATRAVVDAGWYPYSAQVGQTGKTVSPKLYVALGISGAIQHKVGMQGSNVIVAINKDPNAPIFEYSDLGVVGDLHEIVPKLTELVRSRKS